jgi:cyclopropane fatty-acyl-phospholipid synthase-like methyltransferase
MSRGSKHLDEPGLEPNVDYIKSHYDRSNDFFRLWLDPKGFRPSQLGSWTRVAQAGGALVGVEALTGFLAQQTRLDHPQQKRRRAVLRVFELLKHLVRYQLQSIEADQIG